VTSGTGILVLSRKELNRWQVPGGAVVSDVGLGAC